VLKVGTNENIADLFTKPLGRIKLQHLRSILTG